MPSDLSLQSNSREISHEEVNSHGPNLNRAVASEEKQSPLCMMG